MQKVEILSPFNNINELKPTYIYEPKQINNLTYNFYYLSSCHHIIKQ